jgi:CubicO group peptidase (beta-lactamase class C family)
VLAPHTVALMRTNQVGALYPANGLGFGLGFETTDRYGASGMSSVGAFGWGGAYASTYKVDPKEHLIIVFMLQLMPNASDIQPKFQTAVYQALMQANK